jgi:hypothetical protein
LLLIGARAGAQPRVSESAARGTGQLPLTLVAALDDAGCRVPTPPAVFGRDSAAAIPHVAYRAAFLSAIPHDWAVICERAAHREVWVFSPPFTAQSRPTAQLPIAWDAAEEGCDGWIATADSAWARAALAKWRRTRGHALTTAESSGPSHAGIIDGMCEGGSVAMRYWTGRRWLALPAFWDGP